MALTYGFYNSFAGDRKYDAMQVSEMFDGILADGIIPSQGQLFAVTAGGGMTVNVGTGRAWFFHSWTKNDSTLILNVPASDISRVRVDAVVLEVNREESIRANSIKIVQGTPTVNAVKPTLVNTDKIHQYPIAYITVNAGSEEIKAENIENMVGRAPTVFAKGVLETVSLDELWNRWEGEWNSWFANIKLQLSGNVVTNLQRQIDELQESVKFINDNFEVIEVVHTDIITESSVWKNNTGKEVTATVRVFGGGGGGGQYGSGSYGGGGGGGGGGYMAVGSYKIPANQSVTVTIGTGGSASHNGGVSSFGTYLSANGGSAGYGSQFDCRGGSGGTGGGGGGADANCTGSGGNGSYGGGGGGSGAYGYYSHGATSSVYGTSGSGGSGGSYGGGGGAGGSASATYYPSAASSQVFGVNSGQNGGAGGNGGRGGGASGAAQNGVNTNNLNIEFKGPGNAGSGSGGGGGGYGGNGGSTGSASEHITGSNSVEVITSGGGGGGGGYGAPGGNGSKGLSGIMMNNVDLWYAGPGGGGGGGGYGGAGGSAFSVSAHYTCSGGGGGGGYGPSNYGAGGTGGAGGTAATAGKNGVVIVVYVTREVKPA